MLNYIYQLNFYMILFYLLYNNIGGTMKIIYARSFKDKLIGLMGKKDINYGLLIENCKSIQNDACEYSCPCLYYLFRFYAYRQRYGTIDFFALRVFRAFVYR